MRHRISHGEDEADENEADMEIVWKTIQGDLPVLRARISGLSATLQGDFDGEWEKYTNGFDCVDGGRGAWKASWGQIAWTSARTRPVPGQYTLIPLPVRRIELESHGAAFC